MNDFNKNDWALILGGSSGFGLATAKKLSKHGMNICIVHRDRKSTMKRIQEDFEEIRNNQVSLVTYNQDALDPVSMQEITDSISNEIKDGRIKILLHSIAFGNLKLLAPLKQGDQKLPVKELASKLNMEEDTLQEKIDDLFHNGMDEFHTLVTSPQYNSESLLEDEDIANTVYAMGTSLISWTKKVFQKKLFSENAQVIGLTSEGNEVAWYGYAAVSIAKCALESASRSIAKEFSPYGIRSNIVQPGVTLTPALQLIPGSENLAARSRSFNPFKRLTTPQDVANVIYLLCQKEASWVNGSLIRVDGGERICK